MLTWTQPIFRVCFCAAGAVLSLKAGQDFQLLTGGFLGISEVGNLCLFCSPCVGFPGRHAPALCYHSGLQSRDWDSHWSSQHRFHCPELSRLQPAPLFCPERQQAVSVLSFLSFLCLLQVLICAKKAADVVLGSWLNFFWVWIWLDRAVGLPSDLHWKLLPVCSIPSFPRLGNLCFWTLWDVWVHTWKDRRRS